MLISLQARPQTEDDTNPAEGLIEDVTLEIEGLIVDPLPVTSEDAVSPEDTTAASVPTVEATIEVLISNLPPIDSPAAATTEDATMPSVTTARTEDLVDSILNDPLHPANIKSASTKFIIDLTATIAAFGGYVAATKILPKILGNDSVVINQLQRALAAGGSIVCLRIARSAIQQACQLMDWDPRDLAIADAVLNEIQQGNLLTSDAPALKQMLEEVFPGFPRSESTRSAVTMSNKDKIRLSHAVRAYLHAHRHHQALKTRSLKTSRL
jgi:hypothetical protein